MWSWILTGLNILISVHGFSNGNVPQSCESMIPIHASLPPNENDPPYHITYEENSNTGLIRVSLRANDSNRFTGFMLQAREGGERAVGLFIPVDADDTFLLNCNGPDTAVAQSGRISRTLVSFDWQPPASGSNGSIIFRATFVQSFSTFWVNVDLPLQTASLTTAATSTEPSTAAGTTTPDLTTSVADVTTPHLSTDASSPDLIVTTADASSPHLSSTTADASSPDLIVTTADASSPHLSSTTADVSSPDLIITTADASSPDLIITTADASSPDLIVTTADASSPHLSTDASSPDLISTTADASSPDLISTTADVSTFQQTTAVPCIKKEHRRPVAVLMVVDSILVVLKMGLPIIIMATVTNIPLSRLLKRMSTVYCCVASEALEVAALVLSLISGCRQVFILLCVVVSINATVVIFYFLPVGHSHELKKIKAVAHVFSVIHETFIVATIYVGILELVDAIENRRESWPLWVLIPYTVWILLFVIWFIVFYALRYAMQRRGHTGTYRTQREQTKEKHRATAVTSVFIGGAVAFGIAIIIGILQYPEC